ncbi:MAG TPA: NTP transferase domain-containing protein [Myxococcota bacterium]|nr:NTP transferase domain-containing protein [Myxococcota bacterium]
MAGAGKSLEAEGCGRVPLRVPVRAAERAYAREGELAADPPHEHTRPPVRALLLAGRRGPTDAVAAAAGVSHRPLVPVAGVAMLVRVLRTLEATAGVGPIAISIDAPQLLERLPEVAEALGTGRVSAAASLDSPSASVGAAVAALAPGERLLVTTADHPLLTPPVVGGFLREALARDADLVVGVVAATTVRAAHPGAVRTFVPLRGEAYSGANLFLARAPGARRVCEFWREAERFRKRPWRLVRTFGLPALALFLLRRLDLAAALARASDVIGARVEAVVLADAEAAIDVDRPADLALATRLLEARERRG